MITRIILAVIIAIVPLCAGHAERLYDDWQSYDDGWGLLALPEASGPDTTVRSDINLSIRLRLRPSAPYDPLGDSDPYVEITLSRRPVGQTLQLLRPGMLIISVDGHTFGALHPDTNSYGMAIAELPIEIFKAMHDGQTARIEYREWGAEPLIREQSLKGFGEAADTCLPFSKALSRGGDHR